MIKLEYFNENDFDLLIKWLNSYHLVKQWAGDDFNYPLDKEQLSNYIKGSNKTNSQLLIYKAIDLETKETIGHISLNNIDYKNKSAKIGKVLVGDDRQRGKGIGQKMVLEALKIAFNEFSFHRVGLGVFDFNESAIRSYEKVGFKKEGLIRDFRKMGDEYWSLWEMSILESEWRVVKN